MPERMAACGGGGGSGFLRFCIAECSMGQSLCNGGKGCAKMKMCEMKMCKRSPLRLLLGTLTIANVWLLLLPSATKHTHYGKRGGR